MGKFKIRNAFVYCFRNYVFFAFFLGFLSFKSVTNVQHWCNLAARSYRIISSSGIPLTNTFFLLSSGITVTWAHHAIISRAKKHAIIALLWTLILQFYLLDYKFL